MKGFLIFFAIVLLVQGLVNYYIFIRGWQALPRESTLRWVWLGFMLLVTSAYFIGQYLEHKFPSGLADAFTWIGAFWFAAMVYALLAVVLFDLSRLVNHLFHVYPDALLRDWATTKRWTFGATGGAIAVLIFFGYLHAKDTRFKSLRLEVQKRAPLNAAGVPQREFKIIALADTHLGTIIGRSELEKYVRMINERSPDLVVISGDVIDGNPQPVIHRQMGNLLQKIESRYGVFAVTGNHEYIGDAETSCAYLNANNVRMVRDSVAEAGGVYIVGREDRSVNRSGRQRKTIPELIAGLDKSKPMILLDHQPFHLEEAEQAGMDLQVSGHTHYAQIWPLGYITDMVYELAWGYKKKSNTHYYVTCGVGTWGPPVRIGSDSELIEITLVFTGDAA